MIHAIIIRFHYPADDQRFAWRFAYFQAMVWPRILAQTDQHFDVAIRCNEWHYDFFTSLAQQTGFPRERMKMIRITNERIGYKEIHGKKYFEDFVPWSEVEGLNQYEIQSGLDSDDLIAASYIETVKFFIDREVQQRNGQQVSVHVHFQPELFNTRTLEISPMKPYTPTRGSAFFSIYQPDKKNYLFAYERSHIIMGRGFDRGVLIPKGQAWASAHDLNESTGK